MLDAAQPFLAGAARDSKNEAEIVKGGELLAMMNRLEHPCLHFFDKRGWGKVRILFSIIFPASAALFTASFFVDWRILQYVNAFWLLLVSFTSLVFSWNLYSDFRRVIAVKTLFFQSFELRDVHAETREETNDLKDKIKNLRNVKEDLMDSLSKMEKYKNSLSSNVKSISEIQKKTIHQLKEGLLLSERVEDYFKEKMDNVIKNLKITQRAGVEEQLRLINILLNEVGGGMISKGEFDRFIKMMHKYKNDILESRSDFRAFASGTPVATFSPAEGKNKMRRNKVVEQIEQWLEDANAKALEKKVQSLKNLRTRVQNLADETQANVKSHSL
mmetsp:Transcript_7/g.16  ORF Transcript_7/g.16 Transcript_7/m.16 type:complete len:330 (-) Transcript_7:202-1191(-)|eukprot:CAMPEP_0185275512 /NCGR_PEP_ID=MMETSP1359-20130426/54106_1 /TAXON_ID=552665 /ORGANISM="Bigelowiella longifila, Strain CCMP242" /LENGTH=329 /DNA_ID=CAMNT_0027868873 /DNA_START=87 /DNA_END=1076 /DNA_ORIENTATION=-